MPPPVKAGDNHDARLFHQKEQSVGKLANTRTPFLLIDQGVMQRTVCYTRYGLLNLCDEPLRQFRPDAVVMRTASRSSEYAPGSQTTGSVTAFRIGLPGRVPTE